MGSNGPLNYLERIQLTHRAWRYALRNEKREIQFVRRAIEAGGCVLDIGAHKAAFTYWMARAVGPRGFVLAFEPNPTLAHYLERFAATLKHRQVRVVPVALSDRQGQAMLHFPGQHLGSASLEMTADVLQAPVQVPTTTLDAYLQSVGPARTVRLIKCDVESHELAVLRGAQHTLQEHRPVLLVESGDLRHTPQRLAPVRGFLEGLGYAGYFFQAQRLVPLACYDPAYHRLRDDDHQNYVFFHADSPLSESRQRELFPTPQRPVPSQAA